MLINSLFNLLLRAVILNPVLVLNILDVKMCTSVIQLISSAKKIQFLLKMITLGILAQIVKMIGFINCLHCTIFNLLNARTALFFSFKILKFFLFGLIGECQLHKSLQQTINRQAIKQTNTQHCYKKLKSHVIKKLYTDEDNFVTLCCVLLIVLKYCSIYFIFHF